ncbi:hypothetical protein GEO21_02520 [Sphingobacterium faecium]|uniref:hypothetical protein n=1 Tax=Sphingobacterium faecium TaxID=34087 RepID=UPI001290A1CB|nr:hypothetical protein [Sphingobacterium faecium]MQP26391.1 hypothetical protein [Sphingobacterium faecium]
MKSRSPLEADSGGGRTSLEERSKKGRRNAVKYQMDVLEQFLAATDPYQLLSRFGHCFTESRLYTAFAPSISRP